MEGSYKEAAALGGTLVRLMRWLTADEQGCRWFAWALAGAVLLYIACVAVLGTGPINCYGNDALLLLDGAWRILNGQIPHRDFYLALGPLEYMIAAGGTWLASCTPRGLSVGIAIVGACLGIWGWRISRVRMPLVPALLVAASLALMATSPAPLDSTANVLSCAMIYNRHGYAMLGILLVECAFAHERASFWGGVSSGVIVVLLMFLKLNFFGAAVLLLLVTLSLRREELGRALGILAGAASMFALFCLYLRFALRAFFVDMWQAIQARGESLALRRTLGELPRSGEAVTLLVLTALTVLLVSQGRFRRSQGVRTILLGCATIVASRLLQHTDSAETELHLIALWILVLLAQLAAAYPEAKEKVAVAALAAVGLGGIAAQFYTDCISMAALLKCRAPFRWSTGVSLAGFKMDGLRFFDNPDSNSRDGDNGRLYVKYVDDGVQLLESSSQSNEKVATIGFHNPFSYLLRRKPAIGGSTWLLFNRELGNISMAHLPEPQRIFGNADLIMEPHYASSHDYSDRLIEEAYRPYLLQHYSLAGQSEWWTLYRRKR